MIYVDDRKWKCMIYVDDWVGVKIYIDDVMGAGLWSASPLSKPSTQTSMVSLFGTVPARLKPSTGLLGLVRHLGVVSWSKG